MASAPVRPAGFWIRLGAALIDFAVFFLVQASYGYVAGRLYGLDPSEAWTLAPMLWLFTVLFTAAYTTILHAAFGQTIGKLAVGIRVVADDGEPPRFGAALLRYIGYYVSLATLGVGYLMAGLRSDKRALHDLLAGTRVVRRAEVAPPVATAPEPADEIVPPVA